MSILWGDAVGERAAEGEASFSVTGITAPGALERWLWPTVASRAGLFIILGSLSGVVIALGILFWIAQPLIGVGIGGARPGQPSGGLWSLVGPRAVAGVVIEATAVFLLLVALSRWLRS